MREADRDLPDCDARKKVGAQSVRSRYPSQIWRESESVNKWKQVRGYVGR
ncbi:hypothetical protein CCACVL1_00573 [Corchorus capsularis]|uniref:Uncharacterized protein n=1 Tax=Corchorus capsularis TaxID=210143 RepID=A0A1R3KW71_COCAP|nr:hypothetical protein CCACVL1_00573 [Corchorus capsularis]